MPARRIRPKFKVVHIGRNLKRTVVTHYVKGPRVRASTSTFARQQTTQAANPDVPGNTDWVEVEPSRTGGATIENEQAQSQSQGVPSRRKKLRDDWDAIMDKLLHVQTEECSPATFTCYHCHMMCEAIIRCEDCGPCGYFCLNCAQVFHSLGALHRLKIWEPKMNTYFPHELPPTLWRRPDGHQCNNGMLPKELVVLDSQGRHHCISFSFCLCEPPAATLLRFGLWPASPKDPKMAIKLDLMDLIRALVLECHVSVKGLTDALLYATDKATNVFLVRDVYQSLVRETVMQYLYFVRRTERLSQVCPANTYGAKCPACPMNTLPRVVTMDANFGLVRKKSSGTKLTSPKHEGQFFVCQEKVDGFVASYNDETKRGDGECSNFQAGDNLRSKKKSKKLDETGVFGTACQHECPILFCNLRHGERLAYAVFMIEQILPMYPTSQQKLCIMYDIACVLKAHLQKKKRIALLEKLQFAIPIFHCYGHKYSCQITYSPRRTAGLGLVDGEGMERLWSYLRNFGRVTKEMSPENRADLLSEALFHYIGRITRKTGKNISRRYVRATQITESSTEELNKLTECLPGNITAQEVLAVIKNTEDRLSRDASTKADMSWKEDYAMLLYQHFKLRTVESTAIVDNLGPDIARMQSSLRRIESRHHVTSRWNQESQEYRANIDSAISKRRKQLLVDIHRSVVERAFLLTLKKKYACGQAVAKRLCKQLKRVQQSIKKLVEEYNNFSDTADTAALPSLIHLEEVLQVDCPFWGQHLENSMQSSSVVSSLSGSLLQQLSDCIARLQRAKEETDLCESEMRNSLQFAKANYIMLQNVVEDLQNSGEDAPSSLSSSTSSRFTRYTLGAMSVVVDRLRFLETLMAEWASEFQMHPITDLGPVPDQYTQQAYSLRDAYNEAIVRPAGITEEDYDSESDVNVPEDCLSSDTGTDSTDDEQ